MQENQSDSSTSTRQEAMHDNDLRSADAVQANVVASMSSDLANRAHKNVFAENTYNLENIAVGKDSQQTIILEGDGSMRARNITAGDGSVQLIGQLSGVAL
jgi:predicted Mrr-cat superfamily restriction endonuclease